MSNTNVMGRFYRGWKVTYLPFAGKYSAYRNLHGLFDIELQASNRAQIEREIDNFIREQSHKKVDTAGKKV